jgi:hypothetical protein
MELGVDLGLHGPKAVAEADRETVPHQTCE